MLRRRASPRLQLLEALLLVLLQLNVFHSETKSFEIRQKHKSNYGLANVFILSGLIQASAKLGKMLYFQKFS